MTKGNWWRHHVQISRQSWKIRKNWSKNLRKMLIKSSKINIFSRGFFQKKATIKAHNLMGFRFRFWQIFMVKIGAENHENWHFSLWSKITSWWRHQIFRKFQKSENSAFFTSFGEKMKSKACREVFLKNSQKRALFLTSPVIFRWTGDPFGMKSERRDMVFHGLSPRENRKFVTLFLQCL